MSVTGASVTGTSGQIAAGTHLSETDSIRTRPGLQTQRPAGGLVQLFLHPSPMLSHVWEHVRLSEQYTRFSLQAQPSVKPEIV